MTIDLNLDPAANLSAAVTAKPVPAETRRPGTLAEKTTVAQVVKAAETARTAVATGVNRPTGTPSEYPLQIKDWAAQQNTKNPTLLGGFVMEMRRMGVVSGTPDQLEDLYTTFANTVS